MAKRRKKHCPGSFRQQTPQVAKRYLARWAKIKDKNKELVRSASQIKLGVGGLKTEKAVNIAKIKYKQATDVLMHLDSRLSEYETRLWAYKENMKQWRACKKKGIKLAECGLKEEYIRHPGKPTGKSHAKKGCAGNFKTPSKKHSRAYLKRFFSQMRPDIRSFIPDDSGVFAMLRTRKEIGKRGSDANFVPKVRMAMEVTGVAETAKIANEASQGTLQRVLNKVIALDEKISKADKTLSRVEKRKAKKVAIARKRLETRKANLQKDKEKLNKYVHAVSMRRARKMRRRK